MSFLVSKSQRDIGMSAITFSFQWYVVLVWLIIPKSSTPTRSACQTLHQMPTFWLQLGKYNALYTQSVSINFGEDLDKHFRLELKNFRMNSTVEELSQK